MKRGTIILIATLLTGNTFANINFIDIVKISSDSRLVSAFNYIKDNLQYYDHWTNEWTYEKPKEEFIIKLTENYKTFSSLTNKTEELYLLLGDISNYLYNLNDTAYYTLAIDNYSAAIKSSPKDFRAYWFLGSHYAVSNGPVEAIDNFLKAQELLPAEQPADFWNDYAWATLVANMPSHCIFAMDKVKSITGKPGSLETQVGATIHKRIVEVDKDSSYSKKDLWTGTKGEKSTFTSRPLGIKILVDSAWNLSIYDYSNRQAAFIINPPTLPNSSGTEIHYTIAVVMEAAGDSDLLDDYINNFVAQYPDKNKISFSNKYDKIIAYEIKDKTMYADIGGAHSYMIGIERDAPGYPGLLLENPATLPDGEAGKLTYYAASGS